MKIFFGFLFLMLGMLMPGSAAASECLKDYVSDILKLRMSPNEVADSAFKYICIYDSNHPGESYKECEEAIASQLIPYSEKHRVVKDQLARYFEELAQLQMRQGKSRLDDGRSNYARALQYAEDSNDQFRKGRILEHQSLTECKYGDVTAGFDLAQKAIEAYKKSGSEADRFITRCYYYQAMTYLQLNDMDGLAKVIDRMKSFIKDVSSDNLSFHLYNVYSVEEAYYGTLYESTSGKERKRYADLFNQASLNTIQLLETFKLDEWRGTSVNPVWNYYNRAVLFVNCYDRPPMDSVSFYLNKAVDVNLYNKIDDINEIQLSVSQTLAEAWMKNGNYQKAKDILELAIGQLKDVDGINSIIIDKLELYKNLKDLARESHNYEDALSYSDSINSLMHQRYSLEQAKVLKDLEIKYQTKETELALLHSEARRANTLMWLFAAVGLLLIAIVIFVVYAEYQHRRRMQRDIEFANLRTNISKQLTQQYIEGLENERERMSRELHDGVCNDLLAIQMNIANGSSMESIVALIDNCRESVRRISHELMPPEFSYASIDEVIRFFVAKQAEAYDGRIKISYNSVGSKWDTVPDGVALEVYRIVQEAVSNAVKHSGASEIDVHIRFEDDTLYAEIADNGLYKFTSRKGIGLESIRRRARSISASLEFVANEDEGTIVKLVVKIL